MEKSTSMARSDEAVSEVIGMVLILSITMAVIGSIIIIGLPMIESGKNKAKMDIIANSFLFLQHDIEEVVRGPIWVKNPYGSTDVDKLGPSRETAFDLMEGGVSVLPNNGNVTTNISGIAYTVVIPPNNISYSSDSQEVVYEYGAIIRKYDAGKPLMISDPLINIYNVDGNISISAHIIMLNGTLSSTGGKGKAWAEARPQSYNIIVDPISSSPNANMVNFVVYSKHPKAWENFFERKFKDAGLGSSGYNISGKYPLNVKINGNAANNSVPDIFVSIYESRLNVKVR